VYVAYSAPCGSLQRFDFSAKTDSTLLRISSLKGSGVANHKLALVNKMLVAAKGEETRYLVRTLCANLRIGAVRLTVTASLARAFCLTRNDGREIYELGQAEDLEGEELCEHREFWVPVKRRLGIKATAKTSKEGKDDARRLELIATLVKAEQLVRQVFVQHPNYTDIVVRFFNDRKWSQSC
jgi:DNA ligase-1